MKLIKTEDAVGHVLCHDITQIIRGVTKDAVFRKGHIVTAEDIPVLLSVGKEHLYVWEKDDTMWHENEAAEILYEICAGEYMHPSDIKEGKIELIADTDGLLKINREALVAVNSLGEMMIASRHGDFPVRVGDKLAGTRIIPLIIEKEKMERAKEAGGTEPIFTIKPYKKKKYAIVTTGSEVFKGRIKDTFSPVIREKLAAFPSEEIGQIYVDDEKTHILEAIQKRGSGRLYPRCHHGNRSKDCQLRCTGASGSDDACFLLYERSRWKSNSNPRSAGMRHVCKTHNL